MLRSPSPATKPVWSNRKDFLHRWREKNQSLPDRSPGKCQQCTRCCPEPGITRAGLPGLGGAPGETRLRQKFLIHDTQQIVSRLASWGCLDDLGVDFLEEEGVLRGGRSGSDRGPEYGSRKLLASVELHCAPPRCSRRRGIPGPGRFPHLAVTGPPPGMHLHSSPNGPPGPAQPSFGLWKCLLLLLGAPCPYPTQPRRTPPHGPLPRPTPFSSCPCLPPTRLASKLCKRGQPDEAFSSHGN